MRPTVSTVLGLPSLKLRLLTSGVTVDSPVRWVAVSELGDPTPYLEGGEMLLTTGMQMSGRTPATLAAYVDRIAARGVVALGVGVGITLDSAPKPVVAAARARALPLFEVPEETPFIAISLAVSELLQADERDQTRRVLTAQRELTRAALRHDPAAAVLRQLVRLTGSGAVLLQGDGTLVDAAPPALAGRIDELAGELQRIRGSGRRGSGVLDSGKERWEVHSLGLSGRPTGFLAVLLGERAGPAERAAIAVAISLLSLHADRASQIGAIERRMEQKAIDLLLAGRTSAASDVLDALGTPLPTCLAVGAIETDGDADSAVDELSSDAGLRKRAAIVGCADGLVVVLSDSPDAIAAAASRAGPRGLRVGISPPGAPEDFRRALIEAQRALVGARERNSPCLRYDEMVAGGVLGLVRHEDAIAFARSRLAPLLTYQVASGVDLTATLRAYLAANGQWDRAAAELGVHRHTLRYRMRKVAELLDTSVDTAQARMDLWFALSCASI